MAKQGEPLHLLIVDDEPSLRRTLRTALESMGRRVHEAANGEQSLAALRQQNFDLAFVDLRLGHEKGLDLLPAMLQIAPSVHVVFMTAYASVATAVDALRGGAFDYLPKPFTTDQIRLVLERSSLVHGLKSRIATLEDQVRGMGPEAELQSLEKSIQKALDVALQVAASDVTVLLGGESGVGKGVLARSIHARSKRATRTFVTVHCPSLSAELLESELFGHARSSFTGAVRDTNGKVEAAEGGTLFLDEVGDLPLSLQPKLLRLLEDKEYERVGETTTRVADLRIIAATNRDLKAEVRAARFREELLCRLNVIEITLPPLRQRKKDILPLAFKLLDYFAAQSGKAISGFTPEAVKALTAHDWPGNIRELRNTIERAVIVAHGSKIGIDEFPKEVSDPALSRFEIGGRVTLEELEAEHLRRILAITNSFTEAAETLGVDLKTLYRKRKRN